jgi:two-component system, cell cycle sensor histidine kinase and response regulator CckA
LGCEVEHAYNGDEALKLHAAGAKNNAFDMVIVDLTVPGGRGGKEIVAELKQVDPQVHVVVASGYAADPVLADYAAYGFAGCLTKPVDFGELSQLVQDLLDKRESDTV